jgi:D-lactate dehydrogenase
MPIVQSPRIAFFEVDSEDNGSIEKIFPHAQISEKPLNNENVAEYKDVEIICVFIYSKITAEVMARLPNLKFIVTRSVGYNHIDLSNAKENGIPVCNVPDYGSHVIAEHVFALLLSSIRCVRSADEKVENCQFDFHGLRGIALKGKTMGIIGTGKIGRNVCRMASMGFLMDTIAYDPYPNKDAARENHFDYVDDVNEIFERADIISLHVPLLPSTEHMINSDSIKKMKNDVVLINTARGGLIDTPALVAGLQSKKIAYAALDVLEHEKNFEINKDLINIPNVIVTPHIAFYSDDSMRTMYEEGMASIQRFIHGEKLTHRVEGV